MTTIKFNKKIHNYDPLTKTFSVSECDVTFDTQYKVLNPKTGNSMIFEFSHSTGGEYEPDTKWVYKSYVGGADHDVLRLEVCNDPRMVELAKETYLKHKLKN